MDPNACVDRLSSHFINDEYREVVFALNDLIDWNRRGGFYPNRDKFTLILRYFRDTMRHVHVRNETRKSIERLANRPTEKG